MAVDQLPGEVREFANYLDGLLARLDPRGGWCAVFWGRDPDGMRACLDGREIPPWDVVEALLQDLAAAYGPDTAGAEQERARHLYATALTAYDARPGARDALGDRLDVMLREQRYTAERQEELGRALAAAGTSEAAHALRLDLAWARDDHQRATARCAELRLRIAELDRRATHPTRHGTDGFPAGARHGTGPWPDAPAPGHPAGGPTAAGFPAAGPPRTRHPHDPGREPRATALGQPTRPAAHGTPDAVPGDAPDPTAPGSPEHGDRHPADRHDAVGATAAAPPATAAAPPAAAGPPPSLSGKQRKRRRGGARFAGMVEDDVGPAPVPASGPVLPAAAPAGRRTPRGARFAGAADAVEPPGPRVAPADAEAAPAVAGAVRALERLRREGRTGEAHVLLVEAAHWPPARLPLLAAELRRTGHGADWATLLWEAASLPADRLVAAADALVAAGRTADGEQILRQGVVRPAEEIGAAVLALAAEGRVREVRALLDAYVRVRTPEEAARSAAVDPRRLVPHLLEAARAVSQERHWDLVHALRVAGHSA
ncbi:hypothetical protein [Streptomyces sp. NPDC102462]|uniref:hypothetical protein n=1 Tax=Streptomyces sp. NPDC102462 TaxID=3366178 RepID=UPI00381506C4